MEWPKVNTVSKPSRQVKSVVRIAKKTKIKILHLLLLPAASDANFSTASLEAIDFESQNTTYLSKKPAVNCSSHT